MTFLRHWGQTSDERLFIAKFLLVQMHYRKSQALNLSYIICATKVSLKISPNRIVVSYPELRPANSTHEEFGNSDFVRIETDCKGSMLVMYPGRVSL